MINLTGLQRFSLLLGLLSFLILLSPEIKAELAITAWPTFHHDNQRTGSSQYKGATLDYTRWHFTTGGPITASPVIDANGTVYIGSFDRYFYAIANFGLRRWRVRTGDIIQSSAAISQDGIIYVGSNDGKLYAIDRRGNVIWTYQTGAAIVSSPAIADDGTIYFGSSDTNVYALNPDGTLKWEFFDAFLGVDSSPAIGYDGRIYVGEWGVFVYGVNQETGEFEWQWPFFSWFFNEEDADDWCFYGGVFASPVIAHDGSVYIANDQFNRGNECTPDEDYYYFRVKPAGLVGGGWSLSLGDENVYSTAALREDDSTYLGYGSNIVHINANGVLDWSYPTDGKVDSSPALDVTSNVYVGSKDRNLYALTGTGDLLWEYEAAGSISFSSPAIGPGGTIYIGAEDGRLYAVGGSLCPISLFLQGEEASLGEFRAFRDRVLKNSSKGHGFIRAYYTFADEIITIFSENPQLQHRALDVTEYLLANLSSLNNEKGLHLSKDKLADIKELLSAVEAKAGPALALVLKALKNEIRQKSWLNSIGIYWD